MKQRLLPGCHATLQDFNSSKQACHDFKDNTVQYHFRHYSIAIYPVTRLWSVQTKAFLIRDVGDDTFPWLAGKNLNEEGKDPISTLIAAGFNAWSPSVDRISRWN